MVGLRYFRTSSLRSVSITLMPFILILLVALTVTGDDTALAQEQVPQKPNIMFILADDMREDDFEHMPQTRKLLAGQGLTFSNAFVTHSLCCPSRASILRGQYTHNHQVLTNIGPMGGFEKFRSQGHETSTIATWLQSGGYRTVLLGKYLNGYGNRGSEMYIPPGWDEWYGRLDKYSYYEYQMNENGKITSYGSANKDYYTDMLAGKAKDYVRRTANDSSPFFMYLAPLAPHSPYTPASRHENAYENARAPRSPSFDERDISDKPEWVRDMPRLGKDVEKVDRTYQGRLRLLLSLDEMVAGLIEELRATGELDNTYVFFTSDNGYHLGEHRLSKGKRTAYEEALRVPLAVRGPGVPTGASAEQMALNIDFAPTIAELAGVPASEFVDGRSLAPLLDGSPPATSSWRSAFLVEHWSGGTTDVREAPTYAGVRTQRHKYVEHATGDKELYNLDSDPYELENRYKTAQTARVEGLKSRLEALKGCAGEACREAEDR